MLAIFCLIACAVTDEHCIYILLFAFSFGYLNCVKAEDISLANKKNALFSLAFTEYIFTTFGESVLYLLRAVSLHAHAIVFECKANKINP